MTVDQPEPVEGVLEELDGAAHPDQLPLNLQVTRAMSGPLPSPELLAQYDQVMPGLAERIVSMAEREQVHRHTIDHLEVEQPHRLARTGQRLAFGVTAMVLAVATVLAILGHATVAAIIAGLDVVTLAGLFLYSQKSGYEPLSEADVSGGEGDAAAD